MPFEKVSIIIPTYNERENIKILLRDIFYIFKANRIKGEVVVIDDNSQDGTGVIVENLKCKYKSLKVLHRKKKMGLSSAVLDGIKVAKGSIIGVMDADRSHPPFQIPSFVSAIDSADFVVGTRYAKGGRVKWLGLSRKAISSAARLLARPLVGVSDPCSGFFFFRKKIIQNKKLSPIGFKIGLEMMVKCKPKIAEIPYTFISRKRGKSKFTLKEVFAHLLHLFSLYLFKLGF